MSLCIHSDFYKRWPLPSGLGFVDSKIRVVIYGWLCISVFISIIRSVPGVSVWGFRVCVSVYLASYLSYIVFFSFAGVTRSYSVLSFVFYCEFRSYFLILFCYQVFSYLVRFLARLFTISKYSGIFPPALCMLLPIIQIGIGEFLGDIITWFPSIVHYQSRCIFS